MIHFPLSLETIQKFLPHRSPFLLVDRILDISQPPLEEREVSEAAARMAHFSAPLGTRVVGLKNVSYNEPFFPGHFPQKAIMPGVLILETLAQVASFSVYPDLLPFLDQPRFKNQFQCVLVGVDAARFRKPVIPGDTLRVHTEVVKKRGPLWVFRCEGWVEGQKVAEADLMANLLIQGDSA